MTDRDCQDGPARHLPASARWNLVASPALAAHGGVGVPAIPPRLEWSTTMVHSAPTQPPWLLAKLLQDNGF